MEENSNNEVTSSETKSVFGNNKDAKKAKPYKKRELSRSRWTYYTFCSAAILVGIIFTLLAIYVPPLERRGYRNYQHIAKIDDQLVIQRDSYYLYYYDENDSNAKQIRTSMFDYCDNKPVTRSQLIFVNIPEIFNDEQVQPESYIGISDSSQLIVKTSPTLLYVEKSDDNKHVVTKQFTDLDKIKFEVLIKGYNNFSYISDASTQLSQKEDVYYLYYFGKNCSACKNIKDELLGAFENEDKHKLYLVDMDVFIDLVSNDPVPSHIGISNFEDIKIYGTPVLLKVENHVITGDYTGTGEIHNLVIRGL